MKVALMILALGFGVVAFIAGGATADLVSNDNARRAAMTTVIGAISVIAAVALAYVAGGLQ